MGRMDVYFWGYVTNDVAEAITEYERKLGQKVTLIVARPEMELQGENDLVIRSRFGAASCLLVTSQLTVDDWHRTTLEGGPSFIDGEAGEVALKVIDPEPTIEPVPKKKRGRPKKGGSICPMCSQKIKDFNDLGFWWGWERGFIPPYWDALIEHVFNRDDHTCQVCHSRLPASKLIPHHIEPKETGGSDSARNLTTLCQRCHENIHQ